MADPLNLSLILNRLRNKELPKDFMFLGIQPILTEYLQTNNSQDTLLRLRELPPKNFTKFLSLIHDCLHSSIFPHQKTIWQFNTPDVEYVQMTHILKNPTNIDEVRMKIECLQHLSDFAKLHKDTYPLIETSYEPMETEYVHHLDSKPTREVLNTYDTTRTNPMPPQRSSLSQFIIPTIAATSLYMITKNTMEGL